MAAQLGGAFDPTSEIALTNTLTTSSSVLSTGTAGIGYGTGAGGVVTQATSKSTGVTLNKITGAITMHAANLATVTAVSFTLTNNTIATTDTVIVNHDSGGTAGAYLTGVSTVGAGSCVITLFNASTGTLGEAVVLRFTVIKSVSE